MLTRQSRIVINASLLITILVSIIVELIFYFIEHSFSLILFVSILLATFLCSYFVLLAVYQNHFEKHFDRIYKSIVKLRNPSQPLRELNGDGNNIAENINKILIDWSNESREEIDHLKQVETYRREFLTNVSHELKTPIFSAQGYVHTLIDGGIDDRDVNMLYLQKASRSIDRLISIVDDLESISRLEAGDLIIEPRTFDIGDLAQDVIESLELQAKERNVKLTLKDNTEKHYVYADKDLIRQVLVNLIVNSIKYGKRDGQTEVRYQYSGEQVIVDVVDDGIGIEKGHLPRLFERFYRVDKSRSREQGGTGLGLAIVKHILEAHHQTISVQSEIGNGTTFSFSLKRSK